MIGRYVRAVASQGVVSAFHFVLNIALIRLLEPAEYGLFALVFAVAFIVASVSNALFTVPLSVLRPGSPEDQQTVLEQKLTTPALVFGAAAAMFTLLASILLSGTEATLLGTSAGLFIATFLVRTHARGAGYSRFDASAVLRADLVYVVAAASTIVAVFWLWPTARVAWVLFLALSAANLASIVTMTPRNTVGRILSARLLQNYEPYWVHARWALLGAVSTMLAAQGHSLVISLVKGAESFAPIAAGFALLGPARVLFGTIQNVLRPEMARTLNEGQRQTAHRQALFASAGMVAVVLGLAGFVAVFWNVISTQLYEDRYGDEPMGTIVAYWVVATLVAATATGPNALLQALMRFRSLSLVGVGGAIVGLSLVTIAVLTTSVPTTILAVAAAEATMAVGTFWLLLRKKMLRVEARP
ncbi:MAG: hypothetical protein HKN07_13380 [Acidimicrobiia bacterium]|nr:hypothetical protein [Acidimicrobiia bacterium]